MAATKDGVMGRMKEYAFRIAESRDVGGLDEIAETLGGEVSGRWVVAPSPGCSAVDRSLVLQINPARPDKFYVYSCAGSWTAARDHVRDRLQLVAPTIAADFDRMAFALRIWSETAPAAGTLAERYLRSRKIKLPVPAAIRFHSSLKYSMTGGSYPAMVALVTDAAGRPVAVHRTFLSWDGNGKAPVDPAKMALGPIRGGAIRLAAPAGGELMVGEGIETCLSATQMLGKPAWSAVSAVGLRQLALPPEVQSVTVLVDGDDAGERAAVAAGAKWRGEGRRVFLAQAPVGKDFNDVLIEASTT